MSKIVSPSFQYIWTWLWLIDDLYCRNIGQRCSFVSDVGQESVSMAMKRKTRPLFSDSVTALCAVSSYNHPSLMSWILNVSRLLLSLLRNVMHVQTFGILSHFSSLSKPASAHTTDHTLVQKFPTDSHMSTSNWWSVFGGNLLLGSYQANTMHIAILGDFHLNTRQFIPSTRSHPGLDSYHRLMNFTGEDVTLRLLAGGVISGERGEVWMWSETWHSDVCYNAES